MLKHLVALVSATCTAFLLAFHSGKINQNAVEPWLDQALFEVRRLRKLAENAKFSFL
jgi:hypothetical protein